MGRFKEILKQSAEKTNSDLDSDISSLTRLTDSQIRSAFPTKADKENLLHLLEIVNSATAKNNKVKQLTDNIENLAGTIVDLVKILA